MHEAERIDRRRAALIAYDVCRRALTPSDPARMAAMRPVLDAWIEMISVARKAGAPVICTTPVSRADGADVVMLPTDLSAETVGEALMFFQLATGFAGAWYGLDPFDQPGVELGKRLTYAAMGREGYPPAKQADNVSGDEV